MDPEQQLRNLRDFLLVYNRMTEICFQRCSSNFNYRNLTMDEERCVDNCAGKLIRTNHRLMGTYVQLMPKMVQRRMEEMESKIQSAKAAEAAASADVAPPATEAVVASQDPVASSLSTQGPPPSTSSVADASPEAHGSFIAPAGLDIPFDLPVTNSTTTPEVTLPAATTLTNVSEAVYPSVPNDASGGPSYGTGSPQSPIAGAQTEFGSSVPVLVPSKPTSISADGPVSTVAAPTVSTESLSAQERAPELPPASNQE